MLNGCVVATRWIGRLSSCWAVSEAEPRPSSVPPPVTNAASLDQPASPAPPAQANSSG